MALAQSNAASFFGQFAHSGGWHSARNPQNSQPTYIMTKFIITAIATLALASCADLTVGINNDKLEGSYSSKGGLVIMPKVPTAIQIIEPAK